MRKSKISKKPSLIHNCSFISTDISISAVNLKGRGRDGFMALITGFNGKDLRRRVLKSVFLRDGEFRMHVMKGFGLYEVRSLCNSPYGSKDWNGYYIVHQDGITRISKNDAVKLAMKME